MHYLIFSHHLATLLIIPLIQVQAPYPNDYPTNQPQSWSTRLHSSNDGRQDSQRHNSNNSRKYAHNNNDLAGFMLNTLGRHMAKEPSDLGQQRMDRKRETHQQRYRTESERDRYTHTQRNGQRPSPYTLFYNPHLSDKPIQPWSAPRGHKLSTDYPPGIEEEIMDSFIDEEARDVNNERYVELRDALQKDWRQVYKSIPAVPPQPILPPATAPIFKNGVWINMTAMFGMDMPNDVRERLWRGYSDPMKDYNHSDPTNRQENSRSVLSEFGRIVNPRWGEERGDEPIDRRNGARNRPRTQNGHYGPRKPPPPPNNYNTRNGATGQPNNSGSRIRQLFVPKAPKTQHTFGTNDDDYTTIDEYDNDRSSDQASLTDEAPKRPGIFENIRHSMFGRTQ